MDKLILNNYFNSLFLIENEVVQRITQSFTCFELKRNAILLDRNTISTKTFFLEKGYMRSYILNEENEQVTTNIFVAPCFVNDFLSFFKQQPTKEIYQTLTNCFFWQTTLESVQDNFHNIPEFREFSRLLFVINYYILNDRMVEMVSQKAETRYLNLLKRKPHIFQNVSSKIIASYLGVTESTLSRIKKELTKI